MDYNKILEDSKKELEELNKKEAVLKESIRTKALELGLEVDDNLKQNLLKKREELTKEIADSEAEIEKLTKELEETKLSTDEQD